MWHFPSEITDHQLAPSKAFRTRTGEKTGDTDVTTSTLFTPGKEEIYKKHYEEGYDIFDPDYIAWLKINHPTSVSSACSGSSSSATDSSSFQVLSSTSAASQSLADILVLPRAPDRPKKNRKPALNSHAVCITDDKVLEEMRRKETEKAWVHLEREARKTERIRRREEKQRKKKKPSETTCPAKKTPIFFGCQESKFGIKPNKFCVQNLSNAGCLGLEILAQTFW